MGVPEKPESHYILVALHESSESVAPSVQAVTIGRNMSDQDGASIYSLESSKLSLQPLDFIAWVVSFMKKLPILVVASLSIDTNNSGIRENSAILKLKWCRIIAIFNKLMEGLVIEPVSPGA